MDSRTVLAVLRDHEDELRRLGVERLFLFGSTARDAAGAASDVDLFFDYDAPLFSLVELVELKEAVSRRLGRVADIASRGSLHPLLRSEIENSAVQVF